MARETTLDLPITRVTVLEDRAQVERRGSVELEAGHHRLVVVDVAPVLADKTVSASASAGARVANVEVTRERVATRESQPKEVAALEQQLDELQERLRALERELERLEGRRASLHRAGELAIDELGQDIAHGKASLAEWASELQRHEQAEVELVQRSAELPLEIARQRRERDDLKRRLAAAKSPATTLQAKLVLDVSCEVAGAVTLSVEYVVPGACWRPYHRACLTENAEGAPKLSLVTDACVWQRTGESWSQVALRFSADRPSLGAEPPLLGPDVLRSRKRDSTVVVQKRETSVETTGLGRGAVEAAEVPGIDDGGEGLSLSALHPASIPSDGRPHRVKLFELTSETTLRRVVYGELAEAVLLQTQQTNTAKHPLLAGPVDLIRGGGLVGRGQLLFVAPEERFELGWGPDPALRVHREVVELKPKEQRLSSWVERGKRVRVHISNLGRASAPLEVVERVPVSEVEKVRVEPDPEKTTGHMTPNADGFVTWKLTLKPDSREKLVLAYSIHQHGDVVGL